MTKVDKLYKEYETAFNADVDRITSLCNFAKTAVQFIIEKGLYVEFAQYMAGKVKAALNEDGGDKQ